MLNIKDFIHAFVFSICSVAFVYFLHHLPLNQLFIDPFSEAIKSHDVMDIAISQFRDHKDPALYDDNVFIINSEVTDRGKIAETVDFLTRKAVGAVGVDLLFDSLHYNAEDTLLTRAISHDKVVLGYTFDESHEHSGGSHFKEQSHEFFKSNATQGYVNLASNDGYSVRAFEPLHTIEEKEEKSFGVSLVSIVDPSIVDEIKERDHKLEWINFKRIQPGIVNMRPPINSGKVVHYGFAGITQFLRDSSSYGDNFFKDKIVLIGFCGETDQAMSMKDRYFTPLNEVTSSRSIPDMHGVVVHANIVSMLRSKDFINEVKDSTLYLFSFLLFFMNYLIFSKMERKKLFFMLPAVRIVQVLEFILIFVISIVCLAKGNTKVGVIILVTAMIISYELFEFYVHKLRSRIAQRISKYI